MPFTVEDLIRDNPRPLTVRADEGISEALRRMIEHDVSKLPVVDERFRPEGMVTSESILRALHNFGVPLDELRIFDAMERAELFREDTDLFELLDRMRNLEAALIVDGRGRLAGIVTNYDTTAYFRRRAEDLMLVEDIESMLKDYIVAGFTDDTGQVDHARLGEVVQEVADFNAQMHKRFEGALKHYLGIMTSNGTLQALEEEESAAKGGFDRGMAREVFDEHLEIEQGTPSFDELTFYNYIQLLLYDELWPRYERIFGLEREALRNLLDGVRHTRNDLAHFRGDITPQQRDQLRYCAEWLRRYQTEFAGVLGPEEDEAASAERVGPGLDRAPLMEEIGPGESRYAPLALWLQQQPPETETVTLSFGEVEGIIDGELPRSAYRHRSWWANDPASQVQAQQWLEVGWQVASINMSAQRVRFGRSREQQQAYNDFFEALLSELAQVGLEAAGPPTGVPWLTVRTLEDGEGAVGFFNVVFDRQSRFRVELYLDLGERERTKALFDRLHEREDVLEERVGTELEWQRLNEHTPARIAVSRGGSIGDAPAARERLRTWAVETLAALVGALEEPVRAELAG